MSDENVQNTKGLSQSQYSMGIIEALVPAVEQAMREYPPPDGEASSGAAAFIQAFVYLGLTLTNTLGIHSIEYARALQTMAADIELDAINKLAAVLTDPATKKGAVAEEKVDF